ncbi:hypothetical protein ET495_11600 [Xylanimonas allomyrinae]|uniref:LppX_LprAFG lipoprotein n=1 Tax=Xylanimonas allomyrinae TaxID=2509459 RepID=A0A4P6F0C4_9MICO|nr:hypothetical protein [Xylanimonas allomyrinae]QAY63778.1 hypothetical protein ET495_11600 [Xylanimonas allomyrinae]
MKHLRAPSATTGRLGTLCLAAATALTLASCAPGQAGGQDPPAATQSATLSQENFVGAVVASVEGMTSMHQEMTFAGNVFDSAGFGETPISADINLAGKTPEMHMTMSTAGGKTEVIMTGGEVFISLGDLSGGKYLHMTKAELAGDDGFSRMLEGAGADDLAAQVEGYMAGVTSFESTGTDVVDGTDVTLYTMTVDPSKVNHGALGLEESALSSAGEMTVVYALDKDNLPRRVAVTMAPSGEGKTMTVTSVISKVNEPVTIQAPAPEETVPYSTMFGSSGP